MWFKDIEAVVFDYGNTLVEFGPRQLKTQAQALERRLNEWFGEVDGEALQAVRGRQITAPYRNGFVENQFDRVMIELVQEVCGEELTPQQLDILLEERHRAFHQSIRIEPEVVAMVSGLSENFRLGFISNYPCGPSIRTSLHNTGLHDFFEAIVISGEVGRIKPHPLIFETLLEAMEIPAEHCVYIGDNWLADVQGAKRAGMKSILLEQHEGYEKFPPEEDHMEPDAVLQHITELPDLLNGVGGVL